MPAWVSVLFYVADLFFASFFIFGWNLLAQLHPDRIAQYVLSFSGVTFAIVAGIAFELFKTREDRNEYTVYLRKLNTCDELSKKLIEVLLETFSDDFLRNKVPSAAIREEMTTPINDLITKIETNWRSSFFVTTRDNWSQVDLQLLLRAEQTVEATSYGHMNNFWSTAEGQIYLRANGNMQKSGVSTRRVFLITDDELRDEQKKAALQDIVKKHIEHNIPVKVRLKSAPPIAWRDVHDFAIFDGKTVSHTTHEEATTVHWNPSELRSWKDRFIRLWNDAVEVHECFPDLPVCINGVPSQAKK